MAESNDRSKALDVALAQIEKQFGVGAMMRLGDEAAVMHKAISTGSIALDGALGIGGLPRGRVVEIFGPESSGKCLTADTYLWTDHGLETVEELFERVGEPASCASRVTDVSEFGIRLVNEDGELEPMAAVTHNNRRPVRRVVLQSGRAVTATLRHPLRVLNERGQIVWRRVENLAEGDVLVSAAFGAAEAVGAPVDLSEDEALLLGYLVAEGTLGENNRNAITYSNHQDADTLEEYKRLLQDVLGIDPSRVRTYGGGDHAVHDTQARKLLADVYGLDYANAPMKHVPHVVRTAGPKAQTAFLSALYEGDGWIEDGPEIGFASASRTLAEQVQLLLLGLGIPCSLLTKTNATYGRDYYTVLVPPGASARFLDIVGFRSERRAKQVTARLRDNTRPSTQWEAVPFAADLVRDLRDALGGDRELDGLIHDLFRSDLTASGRPLEASRTRLEAIVAWADARHVPPTAEPLVERLRQLATGAYTYERIVAIEDAGEQPTFDVVVPRTHSFLANGVLSHNTTVALHAIAEAQRAGGIAAFIDAEHALDPTYARALGVDINELLVSQPDTGEQALEIADMLVRSAAVDIIVIDSVAALTPKAEIEGEMGQSHVGLQARLMSQALRKIAGSLSKSDTCAVFINQLREKVGVMFGCFSYNTRVTLADGTQEKIGRIVNQKMDVEVRSYDFDRGEFVNRRIVNWFDNGTTDEFLRFTVARGGGNGRAQFSATRNHLISTPHGWSHAGDLREGDHVLQSVPFHLSDFQYEVLLGGLMGDGALSPSRSGHGARFRWGHGAKQAEYGDWKASLFGNITVSRSTNDDGAVFHDCQPLPELADLRRAVYPLATDGDSGRKVLSDEYLKSLTPLSLAIWYMDDGTFQLRSKGLQERTKDGTGRSEICISAFEPGTQRRLHAYLADTWDLHPTLREVGDQQYLTFPVAETEKLHALVAPYVHPSMQYKLLPAHQGRFAVEPVLGEVEYRPVAMPIQSIVAGPPNGKHTHRFDIEVEGSHTYLADGIIVHNSPETTPGGRALKFYSSVRLDVRRIETLKDGTEAVGNRVRVKVVKNKVAPPFRQAEFEILYGEGISRHGALLDLGVDHGIIRKAGAWYTYDGDQLGQGREKARQFLKENDDISAEIEKLIRTELGIGGPAKAADAVADDDGDEVEDLLAVDEAG